MNDWYERYKNRVNTGIKSEEERVRRQRHLQDIAEGKEDTQSVILEKDKKITELENEIMELKKRLLKYEKVD